MRIQVQRKVLTDRSEVFDVVVYDTEIKAALRLEAVTERDAHELADGLADLLRKHTNENIWT